ncbi:hypothetical protein Elgi_52530 [Paenibacillus elgii]|uniref:hypothetical protein n=1 Tax=Paenibacillus elgii TaxID=189691 RepID=UPI002D7BD843|nr:hypothetical protein Elgi_52530 [Paenibacillus elgii]
MKFGKTLLSVGLLASLVVTSFSTQSALAATESAPTSAINSVSSLGYERVPSFALPVGESFKIPSTNVRLEHDYGQVKVRVYSNYTKITGKKADYQNPVLIIDEDNKVIYEVTVTD